MYYSSMKNEGSGIRLDRIEEGMARKKLDSKKLARAVGVSEAAISKLLNSKSPGMSAVNLSRIAKTLGVSLDYLLGLTDDPLPKSVSNDQAILELVRATMDLPRSRQHDLLLIANTYAEAAEESKRQFLREMRDMLFAAADKMGRGEELDAFLETLLRDDLEDGRNQGDTYQDDEGDADGADKPPQ